MITIGQLIKVYSPIQEPPFDGLKSSQIKYAHEMERINEMRLNIRLTVSLEIHEVMGSRIFNVCSCTYQCQVSIADSLTARDLCDVWTKSGEDLIKAYNKFERERGWTETTITAGGASMDRFEELVTWFYSPRN